jgi:hypothetical protein
MGAEVFFASILAVLFTILGSVTIYQAVKMDKAQTQYKQLQAQDDSQYYKYQYGTLMTNPANIFEVVVGSVYILIGVVMFSYLVPVVRGA